MAERKPRSELAELLWSCRGAFLAAAGFSLFINLLLLVPSLHMMQMYDRVLASGSLPTLAGITAIALFLIAVLGVLEWVRAQVLIRVGARIDLALRERLFDAAFQRSLMQAGDGGQPLQDLAVLRQFLAGSALLAFFDIPWMPLFLALLYLFHPLLGWLALLGGTLIFALALFNEVATKGPLESANREAQAAARFVASHFRNAEVVTALGMLARIRGRWRERQHGMLAFQVRASERAGVIATASKVLRIGLQIAMLATGTYLALDQRISPGTMVAASILMARALAPVDQALGSWKGFVAARAAYRRLTALLAQVPPRPARMALPKPAGAVAVEGLVAVPPGARLPALRGVTFALAAGEALGVVGPSAAGKSTLARLLVGAWPPYAGSVRLDGAALGDWDGEQLGPHLGYLPQDIELFDGTIAENIARFGAVDGEHVVLAAQRAGLHELILRLPQGYDTVIGEHGGVLSGGQRQRVGLARALYGDPSLVVLDEPNSNLDDAGEAALNAAVADLKARGKTVVLIAHRPNILLHMDRLLVLRDGQVQTLGPRHEVLTQLIRPAAARSA